MKSNAWVVLAGAIVVAAGYAADKPIKFADLPAAVQKAMLKERDATSAKIKNTLIEVEDGKTYYECETILPDSKTRDFLVDPQGRVTEVEDQVELDGIPAPVKAVVERAAAGGGRITKLEAVKRDGRINSYEVSIVKNGKRTGMELNPDGTQVKKAEKLKLTGGAGRN